MYSGKLKDDHLDRLFAAVLTLRNVEECYQFFEDVCTVAELKAMAQRLAVAGMLGEDCTYGDITRGTGASTATISRVKKCLNYGADGYRLVLSRLKTSEDPADQGRTGRDGSGGRKDGR
ncbi:MAG: YerC/YecD family TrpR-related protein [Peptococcaceae bacterium]|nr:YerC/YecD family TrpR-related protein [Peptococcaceae bacterium]